MAVAPFELKRILADEFDLPKFQRVGNMYRQDNADSRHFVFTRRTRAHSPEQRREVVRLMSVGPDNQQLPRTDFLNLRRIR
jgi:hypothetical protein